MAYSDRLLEVEQIIDSGVKYNLEWLATYLLEASDVERDKKQQYNFYTDEEKFRRRQSENMGSAIIDFLDNSNRSFGKQHIISKKQVITRSDKEKVVLNDYEKFIRCSGNIKLNKEVKIDQLISKSQLNGTINFKHVMVGSTETDYFLFNFTNKEHLLALLKCSGDDLNKWIACLLFDLKKLLDEIIFTEKQKQILALWCADYGNTQEEIGLLLNMSKQAVNKYLNVIVYKVIKQYKKNYKDWIYTEKLRGEYKKCSKCGENKLISEFYKRSDVKNGVRSCCKECD